MRVAVIGAGAAGLSSARHVIANGHGCDVFESAPDLGGTWFYTNDVGKDKYGFPIYSAMYKGLRTNLPKEVMGFPDFPIPEQNKSYLSQPEIFDFLKCYAHNFDFISHIKFNHHVLNIRPLPDCKWLITAMNKPEQKEIEERYDAVMICNGHYNDPVYPKLEGIDKFAGIHYHSHAYRSPEPLSGKRVLVIGAGPSGLDITLQISNVAEKVVLSHHVKEPITTRYPDNVQLKPDVKCILDETQIEFIDGTTSSFDVILHCTGYKYHFPFLDDTCGVTVIENHIEPLYKHMIHIEKSTMCFIGIPFNVCAFQMFDLQARYYVKYLNGEMVLPSTEEMREDTENEMQARWSKGYTKRQAHLMGPDQNSYYKDLATAAKTTPIPDVIVKLRDESVKRLYDDLINFRQDRYKIVDDQTFIKVN